VTRISTGIIQPQNLATKKIRPTDHGMRNFENYRFRLSLYSAIQWDTRSTARGRDRLPRQLA